MHSQPYPTAYDADPEGFNERERAERRDPGEGP